MRVKSDHEHASSKRFGRGGSLEDKRVGSIFCVAVDAETAQLRLLLVERSARGHQLGRRLVSHCIDFACEAGYQQLRLWTDVSLAAARRLHLDAGFRLVGGSSHTDFGLELLDQGYRLDLASEPAPTDRAEAPAAP